ncbi:MULTISPECIES: DUF1983 domain-containing protein [unclassified Xanthomonas]|uniref:DUF1983 domain-containing protein n=1 Tax=unclassified Xanthomonas TaxID=2643310 RepID=UPI002A7F5A3E|nr:MULTISPECIES: DUF1983 domain-containing protein [unclassified Xanthomonas]MDY4296839.1 DUF1983 domain-containing protein [Xanthomonas sp. LF02-5]MDY4358402.1 DUF1983 domain-containing protein [Xanthomonas sp. LF04-12]
MDLTPPALPSGQLVITPHPVVLDGQRHVPMDLRPGESLYAFLHRHIVDLDGQSWTVAIGGRVVERHLWHHVRPKNGQVIEVRGAVRENALYIIAYAALIYFTWGYGATTAGMWGAGAVAGTYGALAATAVYVAGSIVINKVLGPKLASPTASQPDSVYSLSGGRNQPRQYEPFPLLLGSVQVAPDLLSNPYTQYEGNDQFLAMTLTAGFNVDRIEPLYNGDALLSSFEGVQTFTRGMPGMPQQDIPLFSNADTVAGGELDTHDKKGVASDWVQRTSSVNTLRIQVEMEYLLFDLTSKGKPKTNRETIQVQYCATGTGAWQMLGTRTVSNDNQTTQRVSIAADVAEGQYDVRVRIAGLNTDGSGATAKFTWSSMTSVQRDAASYAGLACIGIRMKATGQLNGAPNEIRCVAHPRAMPIWRNNAWAQATTRETGTSNPGAQMLQYARGFFDETGALVAGMGLPDEQIDIEAFKGFMQHCEANGYRYDFWLREARSHDEVLDAIALAGFGEKTWAGGRFSVAWASADQPLTGVVNMATIKKASFQVDYTLANAADGVEYSYFDRTVWDVVPVKVPAPGVKEMLNPIRLTGEGITEREHAAEMARYHLAQSLYQYKSIGYSTDIEYLSYRRLSLLALQHDLTQWGYGGRVVSAAINAQGLPVIIVDDAVPGQNANNAYIGLRIPGERVYRVLRVGSAVINEDQTTRITLAEAWPSDAPLPGDSEENPAQDTIWIYDFKQTPGYRVRVVSISPESDLNGAAVSVVPESPELWNYVKTGAYVPPPNGSLLQTRPVASDLKITERQVVQGNTVFTELQAAFSISGPAERTVVLSDLDGNGELEQVAETVTRTARWRIPGAGTYSIVVRPYNPDGLAGVAVSGTYATTGAGSAPVNVDALTIDDQAGGVRRYAWSFAPATIQSPDFAGVQIRYIEGSVANPNWSAMTPLGDADGYHATAFESTAPPAGRWTFAVRAVNTSGSLSNSMLTVQKALSNSLGEELVQVKQQLTRTEQDLTQMVEQVDAYSEAVIKQALDIGAVNDKAVANRGYISQLQSTKVSAEDAAAIVQQQVGAATDGMMATVQQTSKAVTDLEGNLAATYNVKVQTDVDGRHYLAGIGLGVYASGGLAQSEIAMLADRFVFLNKAVGGQYYYPFEIVNGVVYANAAMIRDGTITNAKIGEEIKSLNYHWDGSTGTYVGWRIAKDGTAQFGGNVEVRGTVYGDKIIGQVQQKELTNWTGSVAASSGQTLISFNLGAPLADNETHVPFLQLTLDVENSAGDPARGAWFVERQTSGGWVTLKTKQYYLGSGENATISITISDQPTTKAEAYRIRVGDAGLRSDRFNFTAVGGIAMGVR